MVFSSLFFVFFFLTANLISQLLLPTAKKKNIAMLIFSLVFYSWAGPRYLFLLLGMVFICWIGALMIQNARLQSQAKTYMIITVALCLIILGVFKYLTFLLGTAKALFSFPQLVPQIALPIGISFYTFQLISYVVDVYRKEVPAQRKYWLLLLYASLFHQCIAGPIVRYKDVNRDILRRKTTYAEISRGISRFTVGLAKKAILANGCAAIVDQLLAQNAEGLAQLPVLGVLLGLISYTMQIYLDFSAYSDMAIGMGLMCGFHYKENFNYPFIATSVKDFWSRWHISLSTFFRDYIYIPLGGSRCSFPRQVFNLFVVWFLTGLWHGANWNYVLWGLYFGVMLFLERFILADFRDRLHPIPRQILADLVLLFSFIIFYYTDLGLMGVAIKSLFGLNHNGFTNTTTALLFKNNIWFLLFSIVGCTPVGKTLRNLLDNFGRVNPVAEIVYEIWEIAHPIILLIISAMALAGASYNPFLYFQF